MMPVARVRFPRPRLLPAAAVALFALTAATTAQTPQAPAPAGRGAQAAAPQGPRLKALIVSGGCCHDYSLQDKILVDLVSKVLPVDWTIAIQGGTGTRGRMPLYDNPDWAKGFDVVVHNECHADVDDEAFVKRITEAHKAGIPAMVIHCSMHSYRALKTDPWREFLGVTSRRHTRAHNVAVKMAPGGHYITTGLQPEWSTPTDELYVIEKIWPGTTALATAVSPEEDHAEYPVAWTHEFGGARVFGTTLGHGNDTWNDPVFQQMLTRAFKWVVKKE